MANNILSISHTGMIDLELNECPFHIGNVSWNHDQTCHYDMSSMYETASNILID